MQEVVDPLAALRDIRLPAQSTTREFLDGPETLLRLKFEAQLRNRYRQHKEVFGDAW